MKRTIVLILMVLLICGCGADRQGPTVDPDSGSTGSGGRSSTGQEATGQASATERVTIVASGGEVRVQVEVADDMAEMQKGLMGRTALAEDAGMLFVYPEERELSFWMKDTLIPLSIAFMDAEGRIVDLQDMKALDDEPPHYTSAEPARYALEVNKGFFDERGVEVGDRATLPV